MVCTKNGFFVKYTIYTLFLMFVLFLNLFQHLEDGRLLIPADRYDKLLKEYGRENLEKWQLVRVSEDFRVIALGLPVPHCKSK